MQTLIEKKEQCDYRGKGINPRLLFLNKFYLFPGLASSLEGGEARTLDEREQDIIKVFTCDPRWPVCAYDFVFKNRIPRYIALRVEKSLVSLRIEGYFSIEKLSEREPRKMFHKIT